MFQNRPFGILGQQVAPANQGVLGSFAGNWSNAPDNWFQNNQNAVLGLASGLLQPGSFGAGLSDGLKNYMQGSQLDETQRGKRDERSAFLDMAKSRGLSPQEVKLGLASESARQAMIARMMEAKAPIKVGAGDTLLDPNTFQPIYSAASQPTPTDDMREYEFAKSQGYGGSFQQFMTEMRRAGATSVNVGGGNDTLRDQLSKKEGEGWATMLSAGDRAAGMTQDLQLLGELSQIAPTGPIQGRLATYFPGFSDAGTAMQSIVNRVAPQMRVENSGATSDIEYQGMLNSLPNLVNRPEANAAIVAMMQAKAGIDMERADVVRAYQNGEMSDQDARRALGEINRGSIMTPEIRATFEAFGVRATNDAVGGDPLADARDAIARGADPNAVRKRLIEMGINPAGL